MRGEAMSERSWNFESSEPEEVEGLIIHNRPIEDFEIDEMRLRAIHKDSNYPQSGYRVLAAEILDYAVENSIPELQKDDKLKKIVIDTTTETLKQVDKINWKLKSNDVRLFISKAYKKMQAPEPAIVTSLDTIWEKYNNMFSDEERNENAQTLSLVTIWQMILHRYPSAKLRPTDLNF
jgi:hypothetical protein